MSSEVVLNWASLASLGCGIKKKEGQFVTSMDFILGTVLISTIPTNAIT